MLWSKLRGICIQLHVLIGCSRKRSLSWLWATLPLPNSMGSPRDWGGICNRLLVILHGWGQLGGGWFLWLTSYRPVHSNESFGWFDSETILQILPAHVSICIDLSLPSNIHSHVRPIGLNAGVDAVLRNIFDNSSMFNRNRVIFTSFNPDICAALNWKQPNCKASIQMKRHSWHSIDPVFLSSRCSKNNLHLPTCSYQMVDENHDDRLRSVSAAVEFTKDNNLLGVFVDAELLVRSTPSEKAIAHTQTFAFDYSTASGAFAYWCHAEFWADSRRPWVFCNHWFSHGWRPRPYWRFYFGRSTRFFLESFNYSRMSLSLKARFYLPVGH